MKKQIKEVFVLICLVFTGLFDIMLICVSAFIHPIVLFVEWLNDEKAKTKTYCQMIKELSMSNALLKYFHFNEREVKNG